MIPLWAEHKIQYSQLPKITKSKTELKLTIRLNGKKEKEITAFIKHTEAVQV